MANNEDPYPSSGQPLFKTLSIEQIAQINEYNAEDIIAEEVKLGNIEYPPETGRNRWGNDKLDRTLLGIGALGLIYGLETEGLDHGHSSTGVLLGAVGFSALYAFICKKWWLSNDQRESK